MKQSNSGEYITGRDEKGEYHAFVPMELQSLPEIELSSSQMRLLEKANRVLGKLDGMAQTLPDLQLFLYFYVRKEALLSSQIEGTQSSLSDFLLGESHEIPGIPLDDVKEVSNYVRALEFGLDRIQSLPISYRFILEMHQTLLAHGRGSTQNPGQFRRVQNWIGGKQASKAVFVPPPVDRLKECWHAFEKFIHEDVTYSPLVKTALVHYQFETIHPFLDGNGRLGRLLIILLLIQEEVIEHPILYLSLYFKENRDLYYQHLMGVRTQGRWVDWIEFFLEGIIEVGNQAIDSAKRILALFEEDREKVRHIAAGGVLEVFLYFQNHPISMVPDVAQAVQVSNPTTYKAVNALVEAGILTEISGKDRGKIYVYKEYFDILNEGTEPL